MTSLTVKQEGTMQRPASMSEIRDMTNAATLGPCEEAHEHWHVRALDSRPAVWERDRLLAALAIIDAALRTDNALMGGPHKHDDDGGLCRALARWDSLTDGSLSK